MSNVLIIGSGPVGVQLAQICHQLSIKDIDMVGRATTSEKSLAVYNGYQHDGMFKVTTQNEAHSQFAGEFRIRRFYKDIQHVNQLYDTIILACTADAYCSMLRQLDSNTLQKIKDIILVSPTFGSHMMIEQLMKDKNEDVEIISFSTYLGDTRIIDSSQPHCVLTTGVKSKLFVGSNKQSSNLMNQLQLLFKRLNIKLSVMNTPLHAEIRNSSLYVHPPLFMNDFSLKAIFEGTDVPVYVYKLFPEGPITMTLISEMRQMWQEMMAILQKLSVPSVNLLKFMVKENYPVRPETLKEVDISQFKSLPSVKQEYLLYVRYSAILIDPFSQPDQEGRYFDFSAVPFKQLYQNEEGVVHIPRMPSEDYYRTTVIQSIGKALEVPTPIIDELLERYKTYCRHYQSQHPHQSLSSQFELNHFQQDISLIKTYLAMQ